MTNRCPCAQPYWLGGPAVYATVGGTPERPLVEYLGEQIPVTEALVESWAHSPLGEAEVFRFSADCKRNACRQWDDGVDRCSVPTRFLTSLAPNTDTALPECGFRAKCQWYRDARSEGGIKGGIEMCRRCTMFPTDTVIGVSDPLEIVNGERIYL
jgi:hypothetical protein